VERYTTALGRPTVTLSRAALERLQDYDWPGNVRELRSVLERAILTSDGSELAPADLRLGRTPERDVGDADEPLAVVEKRHIRRVLARQDGNVARAARSLGISQSSHYQRIQRYGIPR
jgi:DNA-binding NtrC family response regulator